MGSAAAVSWMDAVSLPRAVSEIGPVPGNGAQLCIQQHPPWSLVGIGFGPGAVLREG